ncbi:scn4aa [Symbiodinium sp. CCMP2592]|nr:scn4aa [Symbiodinium sp. CCMP2592]
MCCPCWAGEVVVSCAICRKYVPLPNRPQVKLGSSAGVFNAQLQADLFMCKEIWILLIIDEATRYKRHPRGTPRTVPRSMSSLRLRMSSLGLFPEQNIGPECLHDRKQLSHRDESRVAAPYPRKLAFALESRIVAAKKATDTLVRVYDWVCLPMSLQMSCVNLAAWI